MFTKGGGLWIESIADIGCDAIGLDWTMDIGVARQKVGHKVALQGNLDPAIVKGTHMDDTGMFDRLTLMSNPESWEKRLKLWNEVKAAQ